MSSAVIHPVAPSHVIPATRLRTKILAVAIAVIGGVMVQKALQTSPSPAEPPSAQPPYTYYKDQPRYVYVGWCKMSPTNATPYRVEAEVKRRGLASGAG